VFESEQAGIETIRVINQNYVAISTKDKRIKIVNLKDAANRVEKEFQVEAVCSSMIALRQNSELNVNLD
jgi:hypothetical protein